VWQVLLGPWCLRWLGSTDTNGAGHRPKVGPEAWSHWSASPQVACWGQPAADRQPPTDPPGKLATRLSSGLLTGLRGRATIGSVIRHNHAPNQAAPPTCSGAVGRRLRSARSILSRSSAGRRPWGGGFPGSANQTR
jgi:hypothetical protein